MGLSSLVAMAALIFGLQGPGNASFQKGLELLQQGQSLEAEEAFLSALEEQPGHARAAIHLSRIYVRSERLEEAEQALAAALALHPDGIGLLNELGSFYLSNQRHEEAEATFRKAVGVRNANVRAIVGLAQSLSALNRSGDAMALLEEAIASRPGARALFYLLGTLRIGQGQFEEGLEALAEAEKLGSTSPGIAVYRGIAFAGLGRLEEAKATLEAALQENPEAGEAHRYLGLLLQTSDPASSVEHLLEADRLLPGSAEIKVQLAFSLAGAGRLEEAQTEIDAARALDPSNPGLESVEGLILLALNQDEEALEHLSRAVEQEPDDSRSWLAVGKIFHRRGVAEQAAEAFSRATTADSKNAEAWFYLGETELAARRFEEALTQYKTARSLDPGYVEAYRQGAVALQRLGRQGEAVGMLEQALLIAPEDVELLYVLGSVLSEAGDDEAAVPWLLEARELNPNHSQVRYLLGVTLAKLGRREESREELAAFRDLRAFEDEAEDFQDVLLAHPEDGESYLPLIHHYFAHGREVEALAFLQKASALSPDHLELLLLMARAWLASGEAELAGEAVDRALALDPGNTEALALREKVRP